MSEPARAWRFPVLVGGPHAGYDVHPAAWDQESPRGLTALTWEGTTSSRASRTAAISSFGTPLGGLQLSPAPLPTDTVLEVHEYHSVFVKVAGRHVVEAFLHDQIAYSGKGIDALEIAILERACVPE